MTVSPHAFDKFLGIRLLSPQLAFETLAGPAAHTIEGTAAERAVLERASADQALRPLLSGIHLRVQSRLDTPFRVCDGVTVEIASGSLRVPQMTAVHLHHALQLALWHRLVPAKRTGEEALVPAILACSAAVAHVRALRRQDRAAVLAESPGWFASLVIDHEASAGTHVDDDGARSLRMARHWAELLPLQGLEPDRAGFCAAAVEGAAVLAAPLMAVAVPCHLLLTSGGDSRLVVDPEPGLNKYGCGASPRPEAITFSSCTASSPSDVGYAIAEQSRQALAAATLSAGEPLAPFAHAMAEVRAELAEVLELQRVPGSEVLLAASGTDCELFALHVALAFDDRPLLNIVLAPEEIGGGSLPAAQGLHFDKLAPLGREVRPGHLVAGLRADRVRVESVGVRDGAGAPLPAADVDAAVAWLAADAIGRGERVLLHMVDSSKTGLCAPSLEAVTSLRRRHGDRLMVLVDGAQMRAVPEAVGQRLGAGFMVIVSGSKFYTGPAFSGALLIPPDLAARVDGLREWPEGFIDYLSAFEVPSRWRQLAGLRTTRNVGLFLRWRAALWEMQAFRAAGADAQFGSLARFEAGVRELFARRDCLQLVESPVGDRSPSPTGHRWDTLSTIFTFMIHPGAEGSRRSTPLSYEACWDIYTWLNRDLTGRLSSEAPAAQRALAGRPCHVGQPVRIRQENGTWIGALRIASGARLVSRVAFDPTLGADVETRLAAQVRGVEVVLDKIALIRDLWNGEPPVAPPLSGPSPILGEEGLP